MQTRTFNVEKAYRWDGQISDKAAMMMRMFGIGMERLKRPLKVVDCKLELRQGDVCYITGASGAGKSTMLREMLSAVDEDERIELSSIELPGEGTLVDYIDGDVFETLRVLIKAGLSDVVCMLSRPGSLSEGQKYRFRLAMALGKIYPTIARMGGPEEQEVKKKIIFADEFCSSLDRITASVVAYNVRQFANEHKATFVLAGSNDDILFDLQPDVIVIHYLSGESRVIYRDIRRQP